MKDLLLDLETYFVSNGIVTSAFRDTILNEPDTAVALYEFQGSNGLPQIAGALRSVQVVSRDCSATAAKAKAKELYNALITEDGIINLTSERWCLLSLRQPPFKIKVDDAGRVYYGFNIGVTTYND